MLALLKKLESSTHRGLTFDQPAVLRELGMAIPQLIWSALPDGQVDYRSPRSYDLLGIEPGSPADRDFETAIHPDDLVDSLKVWHRSLVNGEMFEHEHRLICKKSGEARWYLARAVPIREPSGTIRHWVGTNTDVHQLHCASHPAPPSQPSPADLAHLARVNTMGQLATGLAHELNQPLGAILNYAGICRDLLGMARTTDGQQTITQGLSEIARESQRAGEIIRRLRALVRKGDQHREAIDINHEVHEIVSLMNFDLRQHQVQVKFKLDEPLPRVWADPVEIQQVMVNLLQNAIDAMSTQEDRREILIQTSIRNRCVVVRVSDNGPGIPADKINSVFEPFVTTKSEGLGMGLSICRSIIRSHGGEITVESKPGKSVFSFNLLFENEGQRHAAAKFN